MPHSDRTSGQLPLNCPANRHNSIFMSNALRAEQNTVCSALTRCCVTQTEQELVGFFFFLALTQLKGNSFAQDQTVNHLW